jgi:transporter family-2 protein
MSAFAAFLALLAGLAGSVQIAIMGRLGQRVGSFEALAWASLLSAALALAVLFAVRQSLDGITESARQPPWLWLGAVMGTFIVFTITFAGPRIGTTATIGILIAGQLAMGVVIDRYGLFGLDRIPLNTPRTIGIALLAAGAALTLKK